MGKAIRAQQVNAVDNVVTLGVCATGDPRIDEYSRRRSANIVKMAAETIAERLDSICGIDVQVVYSDLLIDGEAQADLVARQFKDAGVSAIVCCPDTWAFPQLSLISLLSHFDRDTPVNITCGNSGPRPGVVFAHAVNGAIAQYGKLSHLNIGNWPDTGENPKMSDATADNLVDWCYAAATRQALKGKRVVVFGHDSMGMETALPHVIATRNTFGLEITRLDMKLLADMIQKESYDKKELDELDNWLRSVVKKNAIELAEKGDEEKYRQGLALYLIVRDIMDDLNAVGGGFMSQLEWGSDARGLPLAVADIMEALFNSTFDHNGPKTVRPYATEADVQGLLTMLFMTFLSGGNPPLFMDFRKVWEDWEIEALAKKKKVSLPRNAIWVKKGFVDGVNSGSASFNWAAKPGSTVKQIMKNVIFPIADKHYFPGRGNCVHFVSPAGIEGLAGRMTYSGLTNMFSFFWDEAQTVHLGDKLSKEVCQTSTDIWPHTFVVPKYATMLEYKQFAPANHFHMTWDLAPARLEYWMDLCNVFSNNPWQARPQFIENVDRPMPLLYMMNGGENATKRLLATGR